MNIALGSTHVTYCGKSRDISQLIPESRDEKKSRKQETPFHNLINKILLREHFEHGIRVVYLLLLNGTRTSSPL